MKNTIEKTLRPIRSFVRREGRLTTGQQKAIDQYWGTYGLSIDQGVINPSAVFGNDQPVVLEIGFGMGVSFYEMAKAAPEKNFIGIEVHRPGVGNCLKLVGGDALQNVRVYCADAVEVLKQVIPEQSIDKLQIFFPDPWHKKRHHKRRLIQVAFIESLLPKLKAGGVIHVATDWQHYAEHILEVLESIPTLRNQEGVHQYSEKPADRPLTKYEQRGQRLGHGVWDIMFTK